MKTCINPNCDICSRLQDLKYYNLSQFCAWCDQEIIEQSENRYILKGNMCDMCNSKIVKKIESEHKIEKIERLEEKIKDKNNDIELVQEILDKELEDKERSLLEKKLSGFKAELFKLQADLKYI